MAIFFPGGQQACPPAILQVYADYGYVATCALLFESASATSRYPYNDEATRVNTVVQAIVADPIVSEAWSGEALLFTGLSHGATAPVIAMARTEYDSDPAWKGSSRTAACFFDGIYNIQALDDFLGTGDGGNPCPEPPEGVLSHARAMGRYYSSDPLDHSCANDSCACDPDHSAEMDDDTVDSVAISEFAIQDWKLLECGSALDACSEDVVPAAPISTLCSRIDADETHSCVSDPMPTSSHLVCAASGVDRCAKWFDGLAGF